MGALQVHLNATPTVLPKRLRDAPFIRTGPTPVRVRASGDPYFSPHNRDRRREHDDDEAPGDIHARQSRDERGGYRAAGRDQQPRLEDIETPDQIVGERVHQSEKDRDRDDDGKHRSDRGDRAPAFDEICRDTQSRAGRDDGGDDQHLDVAPDRRSISASLEDLTRRHQVIDPPHAEGEPHARDADQHRIQSPALPVDHGRQRRHCADDALAERDDGEEAVALGNVMCVLRRSAGLTLGEHGACYFDEYQDAAENDGVGGR